MADNSKYKSWSTPVFNYRVSINGSISSFTEVSGLDVETELIDYKLSKSELFSTMKMPGRLKSKLLTLKRGVITRNGDFFRLISNPNEGVFDEMKIELIGEQSEPLITWILKNLYIVKVVSLDFPSSSNELAIEQVEIKYEEVSIVT